MSTQGPSLRDFIDKYGQSELAWELGVDVTTVNKWRVGHCLPKAEVMSMIKEISGGKLTTDIMIEEYFADSRNSEKFTR